MAAVKILVAAVGKMAGQPFATAAAEYQKRLPSVQVSEIVIRKALSPVAMQSAESEALLAATEGCFRVALDARGKTHSSEIFSETLQNWRMAHGKIAFLIGGAEGHTEALKNACSAQLSFGAMIWPHLLARVMLLEQLYRAECIASGHPYHRG